MSPLWAQDRAARVSRVLFAKEAALSKVVPPDFWSIPLKLSGKREAQGNSTEHAWGDRGKQRRYISSTK